MMVELMRKMLLTGVGVALLTKEKMEEMVGEMVKQGTLNREEGKNLVDDLIKRANIEREKVNLRIRDEVRKGMRRTGVITESELNELKQEVSCLCERLSQLEGKVH